MRARVEDLLEAADFLYVFSFTTGVAGVGSGEGRTPPAVVVVE